MGEIQPHRPEATERSASQKTTQEVRHLLDAVLAETSGDGEMLQFISEVARNSMHQVADSVEAFEEVVAALLQKRFATLPLGKTLTKVVAQSMWELPEARERMQRIWQTAKGTVDE